jgi:TonB-linked SusC/RagA family outer membrane protein
MSLIRIKNILLLTTLFVFGSSLVQAQSADTLTIKGQVINSSNEPVANVSVAIEGSSEFPSLTNEKGEFSIKTAYGHKWLNIAPAHTYQNKRVFLNRRTELIIYLSDENISSGYNEIDILSQLLPKRDIVSSLSELELKNIKKTPVFSVDKYMQGRASGVHVTNRSGLPGSGAFTLIRGVQSINATNQPLYVVDGIPITSSGYFESKLDGYSYNPLMSINPFDISNVTIVKDPSITAAYGSKASNGLIIIETIDPNESKTVIDLDFRGGFSAAPTNHYPQLDGAHHKTLINEILTSSGFLEEDVRENYPELFLTSDDSRYINYQHNTNWQDLIFEDAYFTNFNLNVKGGDEIARYGLSFGYNKSKGVIKNTGYDGYNLRFISLINISPWLELNAGVSLNYSNSELKESAKVNQTNPILTSLGKSPLMYPFQYDNNGMELIYLTPVDNLGGSNPQAVIDNYSASNSNIFFTPSIGLDVELRKNLHLNTQVGLTYNVLREKIFMPNKGMELYYDDEAYNVSKSTNNLLNSFYNNSYLRYNEVFGDAHSLMSTTGIHILTNQHKYDWAIAKNSPENDEYQMLENGDNILREIGGANRDYNWLSFYENVNYSYMDRYLFSASVSLDGSSRLGENAKNTIKMGNVPFGFFYGGGIGWRISSEPFMNNISWLEELKFRLSYGCTGNDDIGESNAVNFYNAIKFREAVGLYPAIIANDELTYELVKQTNGGLDVSLWGSRVVANVDVYSSITSNMLVYAPTNAYFGNDFIPKNNGGLKNTGIDLGLFFRAIDNANFKWDVQMSLSSLKSQITEIEGDKLVTSLKGAEVVNMPGYQPNSFYGYVFEGVYATTSQAEQANLINDRKTPFRAGDAIFSDLSGPEGSPDGVIDDYDKTIIGSSLPDLFGGINNTFTYKRWALDVFVQAVQGNEIFNYVRSQNENMEGLQNQSTAVLNRWQYEGHQTTVPRAVWGDVQGNSSFSSRWIEDGSFLRVKNIALSYTIPDEFLVFRNAQFYISANNAFTFSKYLGYDPEFSYSPLQMEQGIDYGQTPQSRQFMIGVKIGL